MSSNPRGPLENTRTPTRVMLGLLWASLMFLYIYNDYFSLYLPGTIANITAGRIGPLGKASDGVLIGVSAMLAIPSLMICLSAMLAPPISRWLNVLLGVAYTLIEVLTLRGSPPFYQLVVALEIGVSLMIVVYALRWPRTA